MSLGVYHNMGVLWMKHFYNTWNADWRIISGTLVRRILILRTQVCKRRTPYIAVLSPSIAYTYQKKHPPYLKSSTFYSALSLAASLRRIRSSRFNSLKLTVFPTGCCHTWNGNDSRPWRVSVKLSSLFCKNLSFPWVGNEPPRNQLAHTHSQTL